MTVAERQQVKEELGNLSQAVDDGSVDGTVVYAGGEVEGIKLHFVRETGGARLVKNIRVEGRAPRQAALGMDAGKVVISPAFYAPLSDDELRDFYREPAE